MHYFAVCVCVCEGEGSPWSPQLRNNRLLSLTLISLHWKGSESYWESLTAGHASSTHSDLLPPPPYALFPITEIIPCLVIFAFWDYRVGVITCKETRVTSTVAFWKKCYRIQTGTWLFSPLLIFVSLIILKFPHSWHRLFYFLSWYHSRKSFACCSSTLAAQNVVADSLRNYSIVCLVCAQEKWCWFSFYVLLWFTKWFAQYCSLKCFSILSPLNKL